MYYRSSVPPCNPQHLLEAVDGSDDDLDIQVEEDPIPNGNEKDEEPEESEDSELCM